MLERLWDEIRTLREDIVLVKRSLRTLWPLLTAQTSGVIPGSYTLASVTVDSQGRVTSASSGSASGGGRLAIGLIPGAVGATFYPKPGEGYAGAPTAFYLHATANATRRITMASPFVLGPGETATLQVKRFAEGMGAWEDVGSPVSMVVGANSVTTTFSAVQHYEYAFRWISDSAVIQDLHSWIEEG